MSQSAKPGGKAPEQTLEETKYLKRLADSKTAVRLKLTNNEWIEGVVEYFDTSFIRITRADAPNLFIFKQEIKYLVEAN